MHVHQRVAPFEVGREMLDFLQHEVLQLLPQAGVVQMSVEVEQIGGGEAATLEDAGLAYGFEVFIDDALHALVELRVVGGHELLERGAVLKNF